MKSTLKDYDLVSNLVIECKPDQIKVLQEELLLAMIDIVEKYKAYIGGGLSLIEIKEE